MCDITIATRKTVISPDYDRTNLHLLPFECVSYDGPARTSTFFCVEPTKDTTESGSAVDQAVFRGRELRGTALELPPGFTGLILREDETQADEVDKVWSVHGSFRELHYWNRETNPGPSDRPAKWLEWMSVSTTIHDSVSPEEFERQSLAEAPKS
eukprot:TRINITY_DN28950_c0_g1_i1.p1 TRINITY_DN28950_c0_g1~~TRINITY_DN28950_c0_g1_i1.p1  ORF type:complete len:155 (-),score=14.52 TRINITY_DN28950_c0_g1_i1:18-482(-)